MSDSGPAPLAASALPSFRVLFAQHYAFVWRSLLHFGLRETQADDAVQDVFIVVHRRLPDFDGRTHLRSWLFGIARRVARGYQRGELRRERRLELLRDSSAGVPGATRVESGPEERLAQKEAVELIEEFLAKLDPTQRDVFYLADVEGLTAPEIADALGVKLNTVYSRLRSARKRFERAVQRHRTTERRMA